MSCSIPGDSEELDSAKEDPQTTDITENNNSIMSFFKTLVSSYLRFFSSVLLLKCFVILRIMRTLVSLF